MADDFYHPQHNPESGYNQIQEEPRKTYFQWISPGPILIVSLIILLLIGGFTYYFFYMKPLNEQGFKCASASDCDDDKACTVDSCSSRTGICYHPKKTCASGEFCNDIGNCELITSSSSEPLQNNTLVANAGGDLSVNESSIVILNGSRSYNLDGSGLTYNWTQLSGINVVLNNKTIVNPSFIAPNVTTQEILIFQLIVNDGEKNSSPDNVTIRVNDVSQPIVYDISAPPPLPS
ncbi:hypothetical protein HYT25_04740 [Candidatus Pacearchaeota archaeon]|nr:hypothetical protein [Candidatus Pacearchaeota archaeon]